MKIAFFDLDGTITSRDSLFDFIRFAKGNIIFLKGMTTLLPDLVRFMLGRLSNQEAKESVFSHFFNGIDFDIFLYMASEYSRERIPCILRKKAMKQIRNHQKKGHKVVVVSASVDMWLRPWCDDNNLELIATCLEKNQGRITGKLSGQNCNGQEKVKRICQAYNLRDYSCIYAYGDSKGDREMLAMAQERSYKPFR